MDNRCLNTFCGSLATAAALRGVSDTICTERGGAAASSHSASGTIDATDMTHAAR
jgi:hypothetical protein